MKKSFSTLITIIIMTIFSALIVFIFEIKAIKSENVKNEYLQIQAKLHLDFLNEVAKNLNDDSIESLEFSKKNFTMVIESNKKSFELFVYANQYDISLHQTIIK